MRTQLALGLALTLPAHGMAAPEAARVVTLTMLAHQPMAELRDTDCPEDPQHAHVAAISDARASLAPSHVMLQRDEPVRLELRFLPAIDATLTLRDPVGVRVTETAMISQGTPALTFVPAQAGLYSLSAGPEWPGLFVHVLVLE